MPFGRNENPIMKKFLKIFLFVLLGLALIGMLGFLVSKSIDKPVVYETVNAEKRDIVKKTVANGSVIPRDEIEIKPTVSGIISEVFVEAGDTVKTGDILARIQVVPDMSQLSAAESRVRQAEISLDNAQQDYDRNKNLYDSEVIAAAEFQAFQLSLRSAEQELLAAQDNLNIIRDGISKSAGSASNTNIRSTIDGMVLDVPIKKGNSVIERNNFNEGTTIASVADMTDLIFEGELDESEVGKVKLGMPIVLTIGAIDDASWDAELEYIAPKGVEIEGAIQFTIKAAVKLAEGQTLRAGYSANADIVLEEVTQVLSVPESVVQFSPKGDSAFVMVKNGEDWDKTYIETGLSDGIYLEVKEGITAETDLKGAVKTEDDETAGKGRGKRGPRG